jgi:transcription antitermination factor NusG
VPQQQENRHGASARRDDAAWYILRSGAGLERDAEKYLRGSGFSVFLPRERKWRPIRPLRRRAAEIAYPRFPGYIFALLAPSCWPDIRTWPYVRGVLGIAGRPVPLADGEIARLMAEDGSAVPHVESVPTRRSIAVGQIVHILGGPFRGFVGDIEHISESGARMSVALFGRQTDLVLPLEWLEAA